MQKLIAASIACAIVVMTFVDHSSAQESDALARRSLKRTPLQTLDVPDSNYQVVIGLSELAPNQHAGRQSHSGPEGGYVLRGNGTLIVEGQPPLTLKAGSSYKLPSGAVHEVQSGGQGVQLVVTWILEKGKPLTLPAD